MHFLKTFSTELPENRSNIQTAKYFCFCSSTSQTVQFIETMIYPDTDTQSLLFKNKQSVASDCDTLSGCKLIWLQFLIELKRVFHFCVKAVLKKNIFSGQSRVHSQRLHRI